MNESLCQAINDALDSGGDERCAAILQAFADWLVPGETVPPINVPPDLGTHEAMERQRLRRKLLAEARCVP